MALIICASRATGEAQRSHLVPGFGLRLKRAERRCQQEQAIAIADFEKWSLRYGGSAPPVDELALYAAAERGRPGLKADVVILHAIVHSGAGPMYAAFESVDRSQKKVRIEFGLHPVPKEAGLEPVIALLH